MDLVLTSLDEVLTQVKLLRLIIEAMDEQGMSIPDDAVDHLEIVETMLLDMARASSRH